MLWWGMLYIEKGEINTLPSFDCCVDDVDW